MAEGYVIAWAVGGIILAGGMLAACAWLAYRPPSSRLDRRLTHRVNQLELEWSETFDKLNSLAGRIAKRGGLERKQNADAQPVNGEIRNASGSPPRTRSELLKTHRARKEREHAE